MDLDKELRRCNRVSFSTLQAKVEMTIAVDADAWTQNIPWIDHPEADVSGYVASLQRLPDYNIHEKLCQWRDNGFVVFENAVSQDLIQQYLSDVDHLIQRYDQYEIPIEIRGSQ